MPKFFIDKSDITNEQIIIDNETSKHIAKVLRYKINDEIQFCDKNNTDYDCIITSIEQNKITSKIVSTSISTSEFSFKVKLYQAIAKGDKMDTIIQKATELGITDFIPTETKNTVVKLIGDDKINKKISRWQKIAEEAAEQSERGTIPNVLEPIKLKNALNNAKEEGLIIFCYGREKSLNIKKYLENVDLTKVPCISIFIGPEGGFDLSEIQMLDELDIDTVSLGNRILRTETASSVILSIIQYLYF